MLSIPLTDQIVLRDTQEIPNSQEIFVYRESGANIIIDILQKVDIDDPEAAAKLVFSCCRNSMKL